MSYQPCAAVSGPFKERCSLPAGHAGVCGPWRVEPPREAGPLPWLAWACRHLHLVDFQWLVVLLGLERPGVGSVGGYLALHAAHYDDCRRHLAAGKAVRDVALLRHPRLAKEFRVVLRGRWCHPEPSLRG